MSENMTSVYGGSAPAADAPKRKTRVQHLHAMKAEGRRWAELTAYDYSSARIFEEAGIPVLLVGDSAANVVYGYDTTVPVTIDELLPLVRGVVRGAPHALVIADLPFGSYEASDELAIATAQRFVKEAGVDAVKLEGGGMVAGRARALVEAGIPVMGHVGLTPQTATALGGYRAQGRTAEKAHDVARAALELQEAGCFAIVFEAIPAAVAAVLMERMEVPVIGIGAGDATDGQVLVFHDLLGIREGVGARFVKRYADLQAEMTAGVRAYAEDVRARRYPEPDHAYSIDPEELRRFRELLER